MYKKSIGLILVLALIAHPCVMALGFTFPEPDWGSLYREKQKMVQETSFELYAESTIDSAPYYGAKFEPRGGAYIGSVSETAEKLLPLGSYLTNIDDMNQSDLYYPANKMIQSDNVITMVGWTIYNMANVNYNQVRKTLETLNQYNKPMLIRFANEMNCSNLGDDPILYVETFRRVADMIHEYPNLGVVWSPNDLGALDRPFEYFYPGDEYVDWVGVSCYSVKYFQGKQNTAYKDSVYFMTGDYSWATNKIKPFMEFLKKNNINKPVMICECGVATSNIYGEEHQSWTTPRLKNLLWYLVMKYPQIKMINYFDVYRSTEREKFDISSYSYAVDIYNEAKNSGGYITEYGAAPEFVFQPANSAGTLIAKNNIVPLYTLAYIANQPNLTVNYFIDGNWYHCSSEIPYKCNMDISNLSDGKHTLKISTANVSKNYVFYKRGQLISFNTEPDMNVTGSTPTEEPITILINNIPLNSEQPPVIINDRTLVPMRAIFEALGAKVDWNGATQTASGVKDGKTVAFTIGMNTINIDGKENMLDVSSQLINDTTMIPARAVAEAFDCNVDWDGNTRTVIIRK